MLVEPLANGLVQEMRCLTIRARGEQMIEQAVRSISPELTERHDGVRYRRRRYPEYGAGGTRLNA